MAGFADGQGSNALFNGPTGIAADPLGFLFVVDAGNFALRRVSPSGLVSTLTGGSSAYADGSGSNAKFKAPYGLASDFQGTLYLTDSNNLRKLSPLGSLSSLAGAPDQAFGTADGSGTSAQMNTPLEVALDTARGALYIADSSGQTLRRFSCACAAGTYVDDSSPQVCSPCPAGSTCAGGMSQPAAPYPTPSVTPSSTASPTVSRSLSFTASLTPSSTARAQSRGQ